MLLPPALLAVPGVTPQLLGSLFAAAADFHAIQPWKFLKKEIVIQVYAPDRRLVVLMGAGGQAFGLSIYDSPADLQRMYRSTDPLDAAEALCWLTLSYETAEYLARDDLDALNQYGWRVAGEAAYPAIARIGTPGPDMQPPSLQDLLWLEGCLRALHRLFTAHLVLDEQGDPLPVKISLPIETSGGVIETHLRLPGMQV
jgi:hypothetical protein